MHWPVNPDELRLLIPSGLAIDKFDGQAWIGVVPFRMSGVRPHSLPALPWISNFLELNVRTYVVAEEKPGVWFFSLDAANPLAVRIARRFFNLPYFDARMQVDETSDGWVEYTSQRTHRGAPPAEFSVRFRPVGPAYKSREGSLDHWLTARFCLYAADKHQKIYRAEIHHPPWPLQPAEALVEADDTTEAWGISRPDQPPILHFARHLKVVSWGLERASA